MGEEDQEITMVKKSRQGGFSGSDAGLLGAADGYNCYAPAHLNKSLGFVIESFQEVDTYLVFDRTDPYFLY